eukprot:2115230-Amphidinium_carterae.1
MHGCCATRAVPTAVCYDLCRTRSGVRDAPLDVPISSTLSSRAKRWHDTDGLSANSSPQFITYAWPDQGARHGTFWISCSVFFSDALLVAPR